eukprot:g31699.t1
MHSTARWETASGRGGAFAARKTDGSVVTWGGNAQLANVGGDSSSVADQLHDVETIYSTWYAFAVKRTDGTVLTWGESSAGGDSSSVASQLVNVDTIYSTNHAFAAKRRHSVASQLTDVVTICSTQYAFAAEKRDFSVVTWGWPISTLGYIYDVDTIHSNQVSFAANTRDGSVVTWGLYGTWDSVGDSSTYGGDFSKIASQLFTVETIYSTWNGAFAAKRTDCTVVTWGNSMYGGDSSAVAAQLTDVEAIYSTHGAFAAVRKDGTLVMWGWGDSSSARVILQANSPSAAIYSTPMALVAVLRTHAPAEPIACFIVMTGALHASLAHKAISPTGRDM